MSKKQGNIFHRFAKKCAEIMGSPAAFTSAMLLVIIWIVSGPVFQFSNSWQLVINTGTTIITFLMVFIIQNTQNRYDETTQIKLNELIRAVKKANEKYLDLEALTDDELKDLEEKFRKLAHKKQ